MTEKRRTDENHGGQYSFFKQLEEAKRLADSTLQKFLIDIHCIEVVSDPDGAKHVQHYGGEFREPGIGKPWQPFESHDEDVQALKRAIGIVRVKEGREGL